MRLSQCTWSSDLPVQLSRLQVSHATVTHDAERDSKQLLCVIGSRDRYASHAVGVHTHDSNEIVQLARQAKWHCPGPGSAV